VISYGAKRSLSGVICINLDDFLLMDSLGEIEFELTNENFAEETARSQTVRPKKKAVRVEKKPKVIKEEKFEEKKPEEKKKKVPFYQIF